MSTATSSAKLNLTLLLIRLREVLGRKSIPPWWTRRVWPSLLLVLWMTYITLLFRHLLGSIDLSEKLMWKIVLNLEKYCISHWVNHSIACDWYLYNFCLVDLPFCCCLTLHYQTYLFGFDHFCCSWKVSFSGIDPNFNSCNPLPENGLLSYENPNYHMDPLRMERNSHLYEEIISELQQQGTLRPAGAVNLVARDPNRKGYLDIRDTMGVGVDGPKEVDG